MSWILIAQAHASIVPAHANTMNAALIRISENDIPAAAAVHAHAFLTDPYTIYAFRNPEKRPDQLYFLMRVVLRYACRYGEVYATPGMEAVAAWLPPGSGPETNWRMIRVGALPLIWRAGPSAIRSYRRMETIAQELHTRYAPAPHWYLSQLGVEPALHRQGYGQEILTPTLQRIDREAKAVYLETHNPGAIHFYETLGFRVCEEVTLAGGAPPMWAMVRDPR
jgi:ribosomal protein S18 acetylase RimI-like enzyme